MALIRKGTLDLLLPSALEWSRPDSAMPVGIDTLLALQIVEDDVHPNIQFTNQPTGLSLQGLPHRRCATPPAAHRISSWPGIMSRCKSPGGRLLFRTWLMQPLTCLPEIQERLNKVQWLLVNLANRGLLPALQSILTRIPRIEVGGGSFLLWANQDFWDRSGKVGLGQSHDPKGSHCL